MSQVIAKTTDKLEPPTDAKHDASLDSIAKMKPGGATRHPDSGQYQQSRLRRAVAQRKVLMEDNRMGLEPFGYKPGAGKR